jgi:hypothetical protein
LDCQDFQERPEEMAYQDIGVIKEKEERTDFRVHRVLEVMNC